MNAQPFAAVFSHVRVHMSIRMPMLTGRSEHVDVVRCLTQVKVAQALVALEYVHADSNWADVRTKVVPHLILELV